MTLLNRVEDNLNQLQFEASSPIARIHKEFSARPSNRPSSNNRVKIMALAPFAVGFGVLAGQTWARVVGIVIVCANAIVNISFLKAYPVWSAIHCASCLARASAIPSCALRSPSLDAVPIRTIVSVFDRASIALLNRSPNSGTVAPGAPRPGPDAVSDVVDDVELALDAGDREDLRDRPARRWAHDGEAPLLACACAAAIWTANTQAIVARIVRAGRLHLVIMRSSVGFRFDHGVSRR